VSGSASVDNGNLVFRHLRRSCYSTRNLNDIIRICSNIAFEHVLAERLGIVEKHVIHLSFFELKSGKKV